MLASLRQDLRTFFTLILISAVLIIADNLSWLGFVKSSLQYVTIPIQYGLYRTSLTVTKQFEFIYAARNASQENKALKDQLAQILSENAQLKKKLAEAESFVAQQNSLDSQTFNLIAARPIGLNRYLLIDKGSDDGIKVNQSVVFKDNLIGKIKEVSNKKSQVILPSDPDSQIAAYVSNEQGKGKGVLAGQFGSEMLLDKILHQEPASENDIVYTDGTEIEIPRGLILGKVSEILTRDNEVFKQAKVKPVFNVNDLDVVFIVTN